MALSATSDAKAMYVLLFLLGLTIGSYPGIVQSIALATVPLHSTAAAIGVNMGIVLAGGMLGPVLIGAVVDAGGGFPMAFFLLGMLVLLGCVYLARVHVRSTAVSRRRVK